MLLVYLNERLGNTLLATPGVDAVVRALPRAEIDFVGGATAPAVLHGFPLRRVRAVSRRESRSPLGLLRLVREIRRERYDVAIHLSTAASSLGGALVGLSGAGHRIGCTRRGEPSPSFTTALPGPVLAHKVDRLLAYLEAIGVPAQGGRRLVIDAGTAAWAEHFLEHHAIDGVARVAVFTGGRLRKGKSFPGGYFETLIQMLARRGLAVIVFLGPEEASDARLVDPGALVRAGARLVVHEPDIRRVAALLHACDVAVAPDSGPMHLAIAAGTPTVGLFRRANHEHWGPRTEEGEVVYDPGGSEPEMALRAVDRLIEGGRERASTSSRTSS